MTIKFLCPSGHRLKANPRDAARRVNCPICRHEVIVPCLEDLEESTLQEEDSESFVEVSFDRSEEIAPVPLPLLPNMPPNLPDAAIAEETPGDSLPQVVHGYLPDERRVESLKWLTFFLGVTVFFSVAPSLPHINLLTAPGWARAVLLLAVLQACYLAWMLSAPDWFTIRVVMIVFGITAVVYAAALAWVLVTPSDRTLPLGLEQVRVRAVQWSGCVLTLALFGAYLCARTSSEWHLAILRDAAAQTRP